jgi:hypothetical protein
VDTIPAGEGRVLAAAVRRDVVAGYEEAVAAAGWVPERVDLLPLVAASARLRDRPPGSVEVTLGDAAFSVALFEGGQLVAFRTRWRDRGADDAARIEREARRTGRLGKGRAVAPRIRVSGAGSPEIAAALAASGCAVEAGEVMAFLGAAAA